MPEFMLLVRNLADHADAWAPERHRAFLAACETYIGELKAANQLLAAQPLARSGAIVGRNTVTPIERRGEVQVGYYHVRSQSLDEAIAIAKRNPELAYSDTARVEVRPVKTAEFETGFAYPTH